MTGDMYVFAYSWQPEFCYNQPSYTGCATPKDYWKKYFTLHGLWPQYSAGGYPQSCTTEAFNTSIPNAVGYNDMITYWPNVKVAESDPTYDSFWEHEWSKHGTCSGLSQYDYFSKTLSLIKSFGTPASVTNAVGSTLSASTLRNNFGGSSYASLQCNAGSYLVGVYTCWNQNNGTPTTQRACPSDVLKEDTCTATTLNVVSF
jgi:ribonuclease T2